MATPQEAVFRVEWSNSRRWKPISCRARVVSGDGTGGHAGATSGREYPVRDVGDAVVEVQPAQGDPAEHLPAVTGDRPVASLLTSPVPATVFEPLPDLGLGQGPARVPAADLLVAIGGEEPWYVALFPGA